MTAATAAKPATNKLPEMEDAAPVKIGAGGVVIVPLEDPVGAAPPDGIGAKPVEATGLRVVVTTGMEGMEEVAGQALTVTVTTAGAEVTGATQDEELV